MVSISDGPKRGVRRGVGPAGQLAEQWGGLPDQVGVG